MGEKIMEIAITDQDFGLEPVAFTKDVFVRRASRGIVYNPETNKIAMTIENGDAYKVPGGGKEGNETEEETFYREIMEETGCKVKNVKKLCVVKEKRSHTDMEQISTVFVSELLEDTGKLHPDKEEIEKGFSVAWMSLEDAINAVKNGFTSTRNVDEYSDYRKNFVMQRELTILETYKTTLE